MTSAAIAGASPPTWDTAEVGVRIAPVVWWSLCILAFSIPLEYPDRFAVEVSTMTGALFLLSTLIHPGACYQRVSWAMLCYAVWLVVLLIALVTQGVAYPGGLYLREVLTLLQFLLLWVLCFWAFSNLLRHERLCRAALWSLVLGCVVRAALPLAGLARTAHVEGEGGERVTAFGQNPNQSALILAAGLLALVGLSHGRRRGWRPRLLLAGGVGLLSIAIVETGSRGGLAALCAGLLVTLASGEALRTRIRNVTIALLALGGLAFSVVRTEVMRSRIEESLETGAMSQREKIFPMAVAMFRDRPWLGWGPVTNKYELASRLGDTRYGRRDPHNVLLEILTTTGLIGAIPFLIATWLCLRSAWRARAGPRGILPLAMLSAVLVGSMGGNRLAAPLLWLVLAYALASSDDSRLGVLRQPGPLTSPAPR